MRCRHRRGSLRQRSHLPPWRQIWTERNPPGIAPITSVSPGDGHHAVRSAASCRCGRHRVQPVHHQRGDLPNRGGGRRAAGQIQTHHCAGWRSHHRPAATSSVVQEIRQAGGRPFRYAPRHLAGTFRGVLQPRHAISSRFRGGFAKAGSMRPRRGARVHLLRPGPRSGCGAWIPDRKHHGPSRSRC